MSDGSYIQRPNRPLQVYAALFLIVLYVPILFLPLFSFNASIYVRFPLEGFTTEWYRQLFQRDALWAALRNSLYVAFTVSLITTALGVMAARAITRYRLPGQSAIVTFIMLPLVVPGIILGVALAGADQPAGRALVALHGHAWPSDRLPAVLGGDAPAPVRRL
jgi:spermidine/putrescine transport system permease protein